MTLASLRKQRNLDFARLGRSGGVHITQIQCYEGGQTQPALDVVRKLAIALSVSADTLIFDQQKAPLHELMPVS